MDQLSRRVFGQLRASGRRTRRLVAGVAWSIIACTPGVRAGEPTPVAAPAPPATAPPAATAPQEVRLPVAPADTSPAATSASPPAATLSASDAYTEFRSAFDAGRYEAAAPFAQRVLQLAEAEADSPVDEEVQVALMNLAMTQYLMGDYVGSEASYTRAIELVEASGRPLHARLARAHAGLAATYHEGKRHDLAVQHFETAVGLTRRHEGLLTDAQVPLLEKYIDSLTELGRYPEALQGWKYVLRVATRKYGETSPQLAPTLERIGRWYVQVGAYEQARRTYRRAIELIERAEGPESPRLVSPLTALAQCNRKQLVDPNQPLYETPDAERSTLYHDASMAGTAPMVSPSTLLADGERALLRAATIADARADPSPVQVADVRTQLGDWYQSRGQPERALPNYLKAWLAATKVTQKVDGRPVAEALFGRPVLLQIARPDGWNRYAARPPEQVETRTVVVEYTVDAQGAVEAARVVDDSGDARRAEKTRDALRSARYRPRFENGQPVATTGVTFSQPWMLLLPSAEDAAPGSSSKKRASKPEAAPPEPKQDAPATGGEKAPGVS